jgi:hypothetical protein
VTDGYEWLFGREASADQREMHDREQKQRREDEAKRRKDGFEWFFN